MKSVFLKRLKINIFVLIMLMALPVLLLLIYIDSINGRKAEENFRRDLKELVGRYSNSLMLNVYSIKQILMSLSEFPYVKTFDGKACSKLFSEILKQNNLFVAIVAANAADGKVFASSKLDFTPYTVSDRQYYNDTLKSKKFTAGGYIIGRGTKLESITFSYPVMDDTGEIKSILAIALKIDQIGSFLPATNLPADSMVVVMDSNFTSIYSSNPQYASFLPGRQLDRPIIDRIKDQNQNNVIFESNINNNLKILCFEKLCLKENNSPFMYVGVIVPHGELTKIQSYEFRRNILIVIAFIFMALFHFVFTDKKREMENALKESEGIFNLFMDNLTAVAFIKDSNSKVIYSNKSFKNLFGSNLIGATPQELYIDKNLLEKMISDDRETLKNGVLVTTELVPDLNKNLLTYRTYKFKIPRIEGDPLIGGIAVDITENVKFENELKFLKDAAEAANNAKSNFLANISHEIRTPMNGIIGFTDILLGTELNTNQKEYLKIIKKSSAHLLEIINDILDFSKIESGKLQLEYKSFNLAASVRQVFDFFANSLRKDNVTIKCLIPEEINYNVNGDEKRLAQILTNLMANAIKFTAKGCVEIRLEQLWKKESRAEIKFIISDTGIGIKSDNIDKIFERFFQLEHTHTKHYPGTGLGLAIVQSFLRMMDSGIHVKSEPEKGSEFSFAIKFEIIS